MVKNINILTLFVMLNVIGCIIYVSGDELNQKFDYDVCMDDLVKDNFIISSNGSYTCHTDWDTMNKEPKEYHQRYTNVYIQISKLGLSIAPNLFCKSLKNLLAIKDE